MREIIAVCRSRNRSRDRVARVLDRYFWRIGDRTWRGKATNACLDRASRELRKGAKRNTAVTIHEIRSARESRVPIIRIGSRSAFSEAGIAPISVRPGAARKTDSASSHTRAAAAVRIAALFHDMGKATELFQAKLRRALEGGNPEADAVRHELHSATVWDALFGEVTDDALPAALGALEPDAVDKACKSSIRVLGELPEDPSAPAPLRFLEREGSMAHLIGMLILTHHRLPDGDSDHLTATVRRHVAKSAEFTPKRDLAIASGAPFWNETWWSAALSREAKRLEGSDPVAGADIALRASLMFADHLGSAEKIASDIIPDHLANTTKIRNEKNKAADSLSKHVERVYRNTQAAFDLFHRYRDRFPALDEGQIPVNVTHPRPAESQRFGWQAEAAEAARAICETSEGGFFACIMAGTGTGKTRGAPTLLANAAMGDARPERRYLRMSLALGLRVLATQSGREYVEDLGFRDEDVSVLVGEAPLEFHGEQDEPDETGSESLIEIPEWLQVEHTTGGVPAEGDERETDWLRALSVDTDRGLPAFCDRILEAAGKNAGAGRRLLSPPVMVGTIDHLMGVASPVNSRYLIQSLRVATSDLILDEIDQFDGEDIAAIGRLVFQAGTMGRRVVIMSATLTRDIAETLHAAYARGWSEHAAADGVRDHVNLLVTGDAPGSCVTNEDGHRLDAVYDACRDRVLDALRTAPPVRRGEILPACDTWLELVAQVDAGCSRMHDMNAAEIKGFRVSAGMVRMTRIAHTAAIAAQIHSGVLDGRFRVLLCLHAQFPRLHRGWIETRLKRALTRKGDDPDAGLRSLCHAEGVFDRAAEAGAQEIEIVVVTSPVIETGNDLDFDYAILDPISTRSIIQSAGRVRRHRPAEGCHPNVLILGRSPVAMQQGRLAMPGVETKPADETLVPRSDLSAFEGRRFSDLAGDEDFGVITAAPVLSGTGAFPLRDKEAELLRAMIDTGQDVPDAPLGRYIRHLNARVNLVMTRSRKFRRSEVRSVVFEMRGEDMYDYDDGWYLDLQPSTRYSRFHPAGSKGLVSDTVSAERLFGEMTGPAWVEYSGGVRDMETTDLKHLMRIEIPEYDRDLRVEMTYTEFTGFTRGSPEDLFEAFGKCEQKQWLTCAL